MQRESGVTNYLRSSLIACVLMLSVAPAAQAYSVLAHQAIIDAAWDDAIVPLLRQRYPGSRPAR